MVPMDKFEKYMKYYKVHVTLGEGQEVHAATGPAETERSGVKLHVQAMDNINYGYYICFCLSSVHAATLFY